MMYLTVDGMFGGTGIRDSVEGGYVNFDTLGLSSELAQRIQSWLRRYEAAHHDQFKDNDDVERLDREGLEICRALQVELVDVKVEYFSNASMMKVILPASSERR